MEWASLVTMAAFYAVRSLLFKGKIMLLSKTISKFGQIIILIDETNIKPCMTVSTPGLPKAY